MRQQQPLRRRKRTIASAAASVVVEVVEEAAAAAEAEVVVEEEAVETVVEAEMAFEALVKFYLAVFVSVFAFVAAVERATFAHSVKLVAAVVVAVVVGDLLPFCLRVIHCTNEYTHLTCSTFACYSYPVHTDEMSDDHSE